MLKIQIKSILGKLLFEYECEENSIKKTLEKAIAESTDLRYADLRSADLRSANLRYADLRYADLSSANLRSANLSSVDLRSANLSSADLSSADFRYADLRYADLRYADLSYTNLRYADFRSTDLRYADLSYADLRSANLSHTNIRYADLSFANLRYADLSSADLRYADLSFANLRYAKNIIDSEWANQCKQNILYVLSNLKSEVPYLRKKLIDGKVNGTQYEGECACLVGTLGKKTSVDGVCNIIPFYTKGTHNLGEQFFLNIKEGDTPENSDFCKVAIELCDLIIKQ